MHKGVPGQLLKEPQLQVRHIAPGLRVILFWVLCIEIDVAATLCAVTRSLAVQGLRTNL